MLVTIILDTHTSVFKSIVVHHKVFEFVDTELQVIDLMSCDHALGQSRQVF